MLDRQRITTLGITATAAATLVVAVWLKPWQSQDIPCAKPDPVEQLTSIPSVNVTLSDPAAPQQIDLVFAIDTTGSLGPLRDSPPRAVWSIASHVKQVNPQADLRVGLV